jgi:hypothetical protein
MNGLTWNKVRLFLRHASLHKSLLALTVTAFVSFGSTALQAHAAMITMNCDSNLIQTAVDAANDGDTIQVLPGNCTWNSWVQFSNSKGVSLICQATGGCIINTSGTAFGMNGTVSVGLNTHLYRISGFTFNSSGSGFTIWFTTPWQSGIHATMTQIRIDHNTFIPRSPHNPKILWVDDAKIVGDRIAKVGPVPGNFLAQESERRIGELGASSVGFVVGDVSVHEAP